MARLFNVNQAKISGEYAGAALFALKELAVSAGYTVRGSGDGDLLFAWDGYTAALGAGDQGSGGAYDCWQTGASRTDASSSDPKDAGNTSAWCVLEDASGRQIYLQMTTQPTGYAGYVIIGVARAGSGGFKPAAGPIGANTGPGAPTAAGDEYFFYGSRNGTGANAFDGTDSGYYHMWADSTPGVDGALPLGIFFVDGSGNSAGYFAVVPIVANESSSDADPCVYESTTARAWDWAAGPTYTIRSTNTQGISSFWVNQGQADPVTGDTSIAAPQYVTATNECFKGTPHSTGLRLLPLARAWGFYGLDQNSLGWCSGPTGYVFPWPDAATVPLP